MLRDLDRCGRLLPQLRPAPGAGRLPAQNPLLQRGEWSSLCFGAKCCAKPSPPWPQFFSLSHQEQLQPAGRPGTLIGVEQGTISGEGHLGSLRHVHVQRLRPRHEGGMVGMAGPDLLRRLPRRVSASADHPSHPRIQRQLLYPTATTATRPARCWSAEFERNSEPAAGPIGS